MKQWFTYGAAFICIYLVFVIANIPAKFILNFVPVPKEITLVQVTGTLWQADIAQITNKDMVLQDVSAALSFWSLLVLDPKISLTFGGPLLPGPEGHLNVSGLLSQLTLTDANITLAANDIAGQLDLPVPVTAYGDVDIKLDSLVLAKPFCQQAQGLVSWKKAKLSALEQEVTLGPLSADLGCEEGALVFTIKPENDLGLTFSAYVRQDQVSGNGYLLPAEKFPAALKSVLPFLGKRDAQGRYRLGF